MKIAAIVPFLLVGSLIFFNSCKITQKAVTQKVLTQEEIQALPIVLTYKRTGCRGRCPAFNFTVYEDGWAVFNGKRYTKYEGEATTQLTKEEFAQLKANCQKADLWSHRPAYGMNVMDIPTTTIHFYEKDRDKKISWRMRAPEALPTLSNEISQLLYDRGWLEPLEQDKAIRMPAGAIHNELIVQFNEKVNLEKWLTQYQRFDLVTKKSLSTLTPLYLFSFDTGKMSPDKMLEMIRRDKQVTSVEFNKRLETKSR